MPRTPAPYWAKSKKQFIVNIKGKRHLLGKDEAAANARFAQLMDSTKPAPSEVLTKAVGTVGWLARKYLAWLPANRKPKTVQWYKCILPPLVEQVQELQPDEIKPYHFENPTGPQVLVLKRLFNWAMKLGYIDRKDSLLVANLMGHTDVSMVATVYGHVTRSPDFMAAQLASGA